MSPRARITAVVGTVAFSAAGLTVGLTLLTSSGGGGASTQASSPEVPAGVPPLVLDLAVRADPEAVALRNAAAIYAGVQASTTPAAARTRRRAGAIFARHRSLEGQEGAALAAWPRGFPRVVALARRHPRRALAQLELGLALLWRGKPNEAQAAWRRARELEPDSEYAVRAADFLHPKDVPGLPFFVPTFSSPPELDRLSPRAQLALLASRARFGGADEKLLYGVALQRIYRPVSARRQFAAAAALYPDDPEARVAGAVGLFDKDRPAAAFARLGPLTKVFPHAVTVRFHLGLLLLWIGERQAARVQLERVLAAGPSPFVPTARKLLAQLPASRTG
jgi:tetratricopeptide (TPR) repeat protein